MPLPLAVATKFWAFMFTTRRMRVSAMECGGKGLQTSNALACAAALAVSRAVLCYCVSTYPHDAKSTISCVRARSPPQQQHARPVEHSPSWDPSAPLSNGPKLVWPWRVGKLASRTQCHKGCQQGLPKWTFAAAHPLSWVSPMQWTSLQGMFPSASCLPSWTLGKWHHNLNAPYTTA